MKVFISLVIFIGFLVFSVYCYNVRTDYNVDTLRKVNQDLQKDIDILTYALSLIPKNIKNEVFFTSIKKKFPAVEEHKDIF